MKSILDPRLNAACPTFHYTTSQRELLYLAPEAVVKPTTHAFACGTGSLDAREYLRSGDPKNRLIVNKHAPCRDETRVIEQAVLKPSEVPVAHRQAPMRTDLSKESRCVDGTHLCPSKSHAAVPTTPPDSAEGSQLSLLS